VTLWDVGVERQIDISGPAKGVAHGLDCDVEIRELDGMYGTPSWRRAGRTI
jgi:hypothetical protein